MNCQYRDEMNCGPIYIEIIEMTCRYKDEMNCESRIGWDDLLILGMKWIRCSVDIELEMDEMTCRYRDEMDKTCGYIGMRWICWTVYIKDDIWLSWNGGYRDEMDKINCGYRDEMEHLGLCNWSYTVRWCTFSIHSYKTKVFIVD